jgi:hypothetical protein
MYPMDVNGRTRFSSQAGVPTNRIEAKPEDTEVDEDIIMIPVPHSTYRMRTIAHCAQSGFSTLNFSSWY